MQVKLVEGEHYYIDKLSGLLVFTEKYHLERGYCCGNGCRHCPYADKTNNNTLKNQAKNSVANSGK